ncbi:MAG: hypothetical protein IJK73_01135 [Bacteroidales bacterium]|nr:hypothetical protein [Bacteroidales bacterium]
MDNLRLWLDAQIAEAKEQEKKSDNIDRHDDAKYWFGRWQALWEVKKMMENNK